MWSTREDLLRGSLKMPLEPLPLLRHCFSQPSIMFEDNVIREKECRESDLQQE